MANGRNVEMSDREHNELRARSNSGKLRSGLGERKLKTAVKAVFKNFGEYVSFFVALFIIQSLLWMLFFTTATNIVREREAIERNYDYHFLIEHLTASDMAMIENLLAVKDVQNIRSYESYEIVPPDESTDFYSLRVRLKKGSSQNTFVQYYLSNNNVDTSRLRITQTPLDTFEREYLGSNISEAIGIGVIVVVMSIVVLAALFSVRLNHYKFMYGIYMTFGAGFSRLFSLSIWEMMIISSTTLILSGSASYVICTLMYSSLGVVFSWWMIPVILVLNLIIVFLAVRVPTERLSRRTPMSLIAAQDNSNLVSSPKRSFKIFNKSFPYHYELFTTWRFRKYFLRTLVASILFTSIFLCAVYVGYMKKTDEAVVGPEYLVHLDFGSVDMSGAAEDVFNIHDVVDVMNDTQVEALETIEGVKYTLWVNETGASELNSHMLLKGDIAGGKEYSVPAADKVNGFMRATNMYSYTAMTDHYIDTLCSLYDIEGDPYAVMTDKNKIIVSDVLYNEQCFDFKPGDKVMVGKRIHGRLDASEYLYLSNKELLKKLVDTCTYEYTEYEIAAVVHGYSAEDRLLLGMHYMEYFDVTYDMRSSLSSVDDDGSRNTYLYGQLQIYAEPGVKSDLSESILSQVRRGTDDYLGIYGIETSIQRNFRTLYSELVAQRHNYDRVIICAVMILLLSPVVWFFSQLLFYFKREKEIGVLRMFGATEKKISQLYSFAGLIMASLAIVVTVLLGYASSYGIYRLFNSVLLKYGMVSGTSYVFYISLPALAVCIVISIICGFLSSYIPYRIGKNRREKEISGQLPRVNRG